MNENSQKLEQAVALAGLAQSVRIVQHLAWKGQTNATDFKAVLASLLRVDAVSAAAVYGGSFEVSTGIRVLNQQLDPANKDKDPEFVNLVINVIALQGQLSKNSTLMAELGRRIESLFVDFSDLDFYNNDEKFEQLFESCSETYKQTLSKLSNRIQVKGEPKYLKIDQIQSQVRAALLAAIRACFLWRQAGGSRWHFFFKKKEILETSRYLMANPVKE